MNRKHILSTLLFCLALQGQIAAKGFSPRKNNCNLDLLELPAFSQRRGSTIRFYQEAAGEIQPYFVVSYNTTYNIPDWVAWKLTKEHTDGRIARRGYEFLPDEAIKGCPLKSDYNGVGNMSPLKYSRGHMCPASDNKWSADAMHDCFYTTNVAPQSQLMNGSHWKKIEEQCRYWAKRYGEVYIVCGPVIEKGMKRLPFNRSIGCPDKFFKVVMRHDRNGYKAIGWIFTQDNRSRYMSIDEVEQITGLNFFHNLPKDIERIMEAQCNINDWK